MVIKIAFVNGKGGCGKTTSIFHVAGVLARRGEKVLVIDFDKQRNISDLLFDNTSYPSSTVYDVLLSDALVDEAVNHSLFKSRGNALPKYYGVDCLCSDIRLENESSLASVDGQHFSTVLNDYIVKKGYGWVLVDMPPSNKAINDICFRYIVDFIVVPFSSDMFSVNGYGDIMSMVDDARKYNTNLSIVGVFLSRYSDNNAIDRYVRQKLCAGYGDAYIDVCIPMAADVREGVMMARPISFYKVASKSRSAYESLVSALELKITLQAGY